MVPMRGMVYVEDRGEYFPADEGGVKSERALHFIVGVEKAP